MNKSFWSLQNAFDKQLFNFLNSSEIRRIRKRGALWWEVHVLEKVLCGGCNDVLVPGGAFLDNRRACMGFQTIHPKYKWWLKHHRQSSTRKIRIRNSLLLRSSTKANEILFSTGKLHFFLEHMMVLGKVWFVGLNFLWSIADIWFLILIAWKLCKKHFCKIFTIQAALQSSISSLIPNTLCARRKNINCAAYTSKTRAFAIWNDPNES